MSITKRIAWVVLRRRKLMKGLENFRAHWSSFVDKETTFEGNNFVAPRCVLATSRLGAYTYIASRTKVHGASIGRFCSIGQDVQIGGLARHPTNRLSTHPCFYASSTVLGKTFHTGATSIEEKAGVDIGNDVWVGARAMILDGVRIGNGAVIGAGAVVTKDIPNFAIVGGVPARVIRYRFSAENRDDILARSWWDLPIHKIKEMVDADEFSKAIE